MIELPLAVSGATAVDVARACSRVACESIRAHFGKATVGVKGNRNIVTEADVATERAVMAILRAEYPDHAILAEETASGSWSDGWMWVCDPIDGTKNFAQGIPHFAFSLALCFGGDPVLGLTSHPLLDWEFLAVADQGTTYNGERVHGSGRTELRECVVAIDLGFDGERGQQQLALAAGLWADVQGIRTSGSAALGFAYVAAGLWDVYVHAQLSPWDSAAGLVLAREAGCIATSFAGAHATLRDEGVVVGMPGPQASVVARRARIVKAGG